MLLMLRGGAPGTFRRSVRDSSGNVVQVLEFAPHEPVEVSCESLAAVQADIGHAIVEVHVDPKRGVRFGPPPVVAAEAPAPAAKSPSATKRHGGKRSGEVDDG